MALRLCVPTPHALLQAPHSDVHHSQSPVPAHSCETGIARAGQAPGSHWPTQATDRVCTPVPLHSASQGDQALITQPHSSPKPHKRMLGGGLPMHRSAVCRQLTARCCIPAVQLGGKLAASTPLLADDAAQALHESASHPPSRITW